MVLSRSVSHGKRPLSELTGCLLLLLLLPMNAAHAYIGPGLGVGVIAVVLGIVASVFFSVVGILWYPIKNFMRRRRSGRRS